MTTSQGLASRDTETLDCRFRIVVTKFSLTLCIFSVGLVELYVVLYWDPDYAALVL